MMEDGLKGLCATLAMALTRREKLVSAGSKYRYQVNIGSVAGRVAAGDVFSTSPAYGYRRRAAYGIRVKVADIGNALAKFYRVPYEPFQIARGRSSASIGDINRKYAAQRGRLPLEAISDQLLVFDERSPRVTPGLVHHFFPDTDPVFLVTAHREHQQTLVQLFVQPGGSEPSVAIQAGDVHVDRSFTIKDELYMRIRAIVMKAVQR